MADDHSYSTLRSGKEYKGGDVEETAEEESVGHVDEDLRNELYQSEVSDGDAETDHHAQGATEASRNSGDSMSTKDLFVFMQQHQAQMMLLMQQQQQQQQEARMQQQQQQQQALMQQMMQSQEQQRRDQEQQRKEERERQEQQRREDLERHKQEMERQDQLRKVEMEKQMELIANIDMIEDYPLQPPIAEDPDFNQQIPQEEQYVTETLDQEGYDDVTPLSQYGQRPEPHNGDEIGLNAYSGMNAGSTLDNEVGGGMGPLMDNYPPSPQGNVPQIHDEINQNGLGVSAYSPDQAIPQASDYDLTDNSKNHQRPNYDTYHAYGFPQNSQIGTDNARKSSDQTGSQATKNYQRANYDTYGFPQYGQIGTDMYNVGKSAVEQQHDQEQNNDGASLYYYGMYDGIQDQMYPLEFIPLGKAPAVGQVREDEILGNKFGDYFTSFDDEIAFELPKDLHKNCWLQSMLATRWGFGPSCNADGTYSSKQCHQKRCWCTDQQGNKLKKIGGLHDDGYYFGLPALTLQCSQN